MAQSASGDESRSPRVDGGHRALHLHHVSVLFVCWCMFFSFSCCTWGPFTGVSVVLDSDTVRGLCSWTSHISVRRQCMECAPVLSTFCLVGFSSGPHHDPLQFLGACWCLPLDFESVSSAPNGFVTDALFCTPSSWCPVARVHPNGDVGEGPDTWFDSGFMYMRKSWTYSPSLVSALKAESYRGASLWATTSHVNGEALSQVSALRADSSCFGVYGMDPFSCKRSVGSI